MFERTPEQVRFYGSRKWKKCRRIYLSLHPLCERCAQLGIVRRAEHVHHRIYLDATSYTVPEVALNFENLEALCFDCHQREHHRNKDVPDDLYFDAAGNLRQEVRGESREPSD